MHRYLGPLVAVMLGVAIAASLGIASATAGGGNSANAKLCQKGGWMNLVRSENGSSFANQSECVSYASAGGTLGPKPAIVHYLRPAADYTDWGLHLWGDAIADGVATTWDSPLQREGIDDYGAFYVIPLKDATKPVYFILHRPSGDSVPDTREPGGDRSFVPATNREIWLKQGDPTIYTSRPS